MILGISRQGFLDQVARSGLKTVKDLKEARDCHVLAPVVCRDTFIQKLQWPHYSSLGGVGY